MYKTGSDTKTASHFFEHFSRSYHVDDISQNEAEYINNASVGALIFAESYEGPLYEYDICSMYPSIMMDSHMLFPLKQGTWMKYTQEEFDDREFYAYGIYRCKVHPLGKRNKDRLFRFNPDNHYTHFDLNMAKELGFKVALIIDTQPNLLHYPRNCLINGHKLFYKYIIMLFKMKENKNSSAALKTRANSILNTLWGYLTKTAVIEKLVKESDTELTEIYDNRNIHMICPLKDGSLRIQITKNEKIFETNYARIKPFLLARGRKMIADLILNICPNQKDVVRTHTDSILSKTPLKLENSKYKLGSLVFKQSSEHAIVHNSVFVEW